MMPTREVIRAMYVRILRDGNGKVLPSEAAMLVGGFFGVSPHMVLLTMLNSATPPTPAAGSPAHPKEEKE